MMENFTMEKVMADLKVRLGSLILDNPVIPASGTFGFGKKFAQLYDLIEIGRASCRERV